MELSELELRLSNNETNFSECELRELVFEYSFEEISSGDGRWYKRMTSCIKIGAGDKFRYFAIEWDKGLTENQDHMFDNQPYEVARKIEKKVIEVTNVKYTKL